MLDVRQQEGQKMIFINGRGGVGKLVVGHWKKWEAKAFSCIGNASFHFTSSSKYEDQLTINNEGGKADRFVRSEIQSLRKELKGLLETDPKH